MQYRYKPYTAKTVGELWDKLATFMLGSPKFEDTSGWFPGMSIETEFSGLNESIFNLRHELGEVRHLKLLALSKQMRAYFEADPDDENGEAIKGRELVLEMEHLLQELLVTRP